MSDLIAYSILLFFTYIAIKAITIKIDYNSTECFNNWVKVQLMIYGYIWFMVCIPMLVIGYIQN